MVYFVSIMFLVSTYYFVKYYQQKKDEKLIISKLSDKKRMGSLLQPLMAKITEFLQRINKRLPIKTYRKNIQKMLEGSHAEKGYTADKHIAVKELSAFAAAILYVVLAGKIDILGLLICTAGYFIPDYDVSERKKKYELQIMKNLPYCIDIIQMCVEAGLTFDAAVMKYVEKAKDNPLKKEFQVYLTDLRLGKTRKEALKETSERVNIVEFSSFADAVTQSFELGTGIAGTLKIQASQIRTKRTQRIEKLAMQAPVKLLVPLVLFIFPVVFIMIFGPIIIRLIRSF